jgi:hypothetical protein
MTGYNNSADQVTVGPYPNTGTSGTASQTLSQSAPTYGNLTRLPSPWPGIAAIKSAYPSIANNEIALVYSGGAAPSHNDSYVNYTTGMLGMAKLLYDISVAQGAPIYQFANAQAIYDEIRRRQMAGPDPYDTPGLSFRNAPKYAVGYIGAAW